MLKSKTISGFFVLTGLSYILFAGLLEVRIIEPKLFRPQGTLNFGLVLVAIGSSIEVLAD